MSIIYEALRKSQRARLTRKSNVVSRVIKPGRKHLAFTLLALSGLTLLVVSYMFATSTTTKLASDKPATPPLLIKKPVAVAAFKAPHMTLDGVFLSNKEKLVMINRHTYHIGDLVYDMKVASISMDKVVLKGKTHSIVLQNSLVQAQ